MGHPACESWRTETDRVRAAADSAPRHGGGAAHELSSSTPGISYSPTRFSSSCSPSASLALAWASLSKTSQKENSARRAKPRCMQKRCALRYIREADGASPSTPPPSFSPRGGGSELTSNGTAAALTQPVAPGSSFAQASRKASTSAAETISSRGWWRAEKLSRMTATIKLSRTKDPITMKETKYGVAYCDPQFETGSSEKGNVAPSGEHPRPSVTPASAMMSDHSSPVRHWKRRRAADEMVSKLRWSVIPSPCITNVKSCIPTTEYMKTTRASNELTFHSAGKERAIVFSRSRSPPKLLRSLRMRRIRRTRRTRSKPAGIGSTLVRISEATSSRSEIRTSAKSSWHHGSRK
mmetsp:Transcript_25379/g.76965  ORF Transcript_25379/g.76965 Transcript_25379/m.76965 type:complete len:352 (-) Transcript_25379:3934-4989(-)